MILSQSKFLFISVILASIYFLISVLTRNIGLLSDTFSKSYPLNYKTSILSSLVLGSFESLGVFGFWTLIIIATLIGLNLSLILERLKNIKKPSGLFAGGVFFGVLGGGCSACSIPILSLFGISSSFVYLPFHGREVAILSIALLFGSLLILWRSRSVAKNCQVASN